MSRRAFMHGGALFMAGTGFEAARAAEPSAATKPVARPAVRIGLLTDAHYADLPPAGERNYRESIPKVTEAVARFKKARADFAVELGDFIDAAETVKGEIAHLETIEKVYAKFTGPRHYVLGNHCVWTLTKKQFLDNCEARAPFYSFDQKDFHFVVLDACNREDGVSYGGRNYEWTDTDIPPKQREWLRADLEATKKRTIAFVHQRIDTEGHYAIKNGPAVRRILAESGKVLAVVQGHNHINDYREFDGIHYCTLEAMVDGSGAKNSAYAVFDIHADGSMRIDGFRKQKDHAWPARA